MNYKEYIRKSIQELTKEYKITVVDEVNFNYNPEEKEILIVLKQLSGSVIGDVKFIPVQLNIFTSENEVNETLSIFDLFVAKYSNSYTMLKFDYIKQDYSTPIVGNNFLQVGDSLRAEIFVSGTLLVTQNISDVTKISINGKEINYTNVVFTYSTQANPSKKVDSNLQEVLISEANLQITLTTYSQINPFNTMLSLLRQGKKSPNDTYTLKVEYNDGVEEVYNCRILSYNGQHDRTNPASRSVVFVSC